ncbi:MAG: hypothetical protein RLN88_12210 [Ekhidna sp.]|uniref:hypothetical protein n=1 Tax=Ekhidna sp. TaxID=2608089 RepID=UPI0032EF2D97
MKRLIILLCYASLISCQDKVICPAFQSTYILDDSTRNAYFSYVWQLDENTRAEYLAKQRGGNANDTLGVVAQPKTDYYAYAGEKVVPWRVQKKTKYGIVKPAWYPINNYQLRTAPMENVLAPEPVSNDFVASDFSDSLGEDSLSIAMDSLSMDSVKTETVVAEEKTKYLYGYDPADNFNVEQEYYNKYYAYKFIDNRPKPKPVPADSLASVPDSLQTKEPFFKGLFKKKKKGEEEVEETEAPDEEVEVPPVGAEGTTEEEDDGNG